MLNPSQKITPGAAAEAPLPDRLVFHDRLATALAAAEQAKQVIAVVCSIQMQGSRSDLEDWIKALNLSPKLTAVFGGAVWALLEGETVGRFSADSFPAPLKGQLVNGEQGLGWAATPGDGYNPDALIAAAHQAAMAQARTRPTATDPLTRPPAALYYQPQINLSNGQVIGFEALTRPEEAEALAGVSAVPPDLDWLLSCVARDMERLRDSAAANLRIAINLSLPQVISDHGQEALIGLTRRLGSHRLEIEITEQEPVLSLTEARDRLLALKAEGLRFALDDFGVGFATLTRLERLPFDTLKIDKGFIAALDHADPALRVEAIAIVQAALQLGQRSALLVVAEGVETAAQQRCLQELGCPAGQGFLFSAALPLDQALAFVLDA